MNHKEAADAIHAWMRQMSGTQFEEFAVELLGLMGARKVVRSGSAGDGGIDGRGVFFGDIRFAFQAKQWDRDVPPKEVRDFIGALTNEGLNIGYFFASGRFTQQAREEADKAQRQGMMVKLYDGERISDAMIRDRHGVKEVRRPVLIFDEKWWAKRLKQVCDSVDQNENGTELHRWIGRPKNSECGNFIYDMADSGMPRKKLLDLARDKGFNRNSASAWLNNWRTYNSFRIMDGMPDASDEEKIAAVVDFGIPEKVARHRLENRAKFYR